MNEHEKKKNVELVTLLRTTMIKYRIKELDGVFTVQMDYGTGMGWLDYGRPHHSFEKAMAEIYHHKKLVSDRKNREARTKYHEVTNNPIKQQI